MPADFDINKIFICQICGKEYKHLGHFWREHEIASTSYFETYFPRKNPYTNKKLHFNKSLDNYFLNDFSSKDEMKEYFRALKDIEIVEYCKELLLRRKFIKNWVYTPSYVELKTVFIPSTIFYDKILFGGYYEFCRSIGFAPRFVKPVESFITPSDDLLISVDTREQNALTFKHFQLKTLPFGDYTIDNCNVYIERKSLIDFIGSFGNGLARIKDEIWRAKQAGAYIIVLVEEKLDFALHYSDIQYKKVKSKASPTFIFHNVREIMQTFDNVQFVFGGDRPKCQNLVKFFLANTKNVQHIDIQEFLVKSSG
jgi:hypothetical protein